MQSLIHVIGFKKVLELAQAGQLDEMKTLLAGLQDEFLAMFEENEALKSQLDEVAHILDMSENMEFDGQKYWLDQDRRREGPFCQLCYDRDGLLIRLEEQDKHWRCRNCSSAFMKPHPRPAPRKDDAIPRSLLKNPIPLFVK